MWTFAVADGGADAVIVDRTHHTVAAPGASVAVRLGREAHVPETDPVPTAVDVVQAAVPLTGHAVTCTACARAVELSVVTCTVVAVVPTMLLLFVRVSGYVTDGVVDEKVVVICSVPLIAAASFPMVTLDDAVPVAVQSAQAAVDPPPTKSATRTTASRRRRRAVTVPPASRSR
jgi:hypothetical protein